MSRMHRALHVLAGIALATAASSGCAILDGALDDDDGPDDPGLPPDGGIEPGQRCVGPNQPACAGSNCDHSFFAGLAPIGTSIDTCPLGTDAFDMGACLANGLPADGATLVIRIAIPEPGNYEVCANPGAPDAEVFVSRECASTPSELTCLDAVSSGCVTDFFEPGPLFLYMQEPVDGACVGLQLSVLDVGISEPTQ